MAGLGKGFFTKQPAIANRSCNIHTIGEMR